MLIGICGGRVRWTRRMSSPIRKAYESGNYSSDINKLRKIQIVLVFGRVEPLVRARVRDPKLKPLVWFGNSGNINPTGEAWITTDNQ